MKPAIFLLLVAVSLPAQTSRDGYRNAYRAWREADQTLERDAAEGGPAIAERANRAAALAAAYGTERVAYVQKFAADTEQTLSALDSPPGEETTGLSTASLQRLVATETAATAHYLDLFAKDTDEGIQRLRQALQQERASLAALDAAIAGRKKAESAVTAAAMAMEESRDRVLDQRAVLVAGLKETTEQTTAEVSGWAEYYQKLAEGAKDVAAPAPTTSAVPAAPTVSNPAPPPAAPAVTPIPLVRYTGSWTFPAVNGLFHGPQPQFVDMGVREENGRAIGTMMVRFKLPPGNNSAAELRFQFSGAFKNTRTQTFDLLTADGAKGTIELIPGPAFNLLEVNIQTEPRPGKIQQANMILVKQ